MYMRWHPSHADKLASTATQEKSVRFWDVRAQKNTATLTTPGHNLYLAWTHDGNYLAVGNKEDSTSRCINSTLRRQFQMCGREA
jgi:THO complex subunit 3